MAVSICRKADPQGGRRGGILRFPAALTVVLCSLLLLAGCGGKSSTPAASGPGNGPAVTPVPAGEAGSVQLKLSAAQEGGNWRLILSAPEAADLYQLAGTLLYDPARYAIRRVEAGGGLGDPRESYFLDSEARPGERGFAYTRRYAGPGASGNTSLIHFIIEPVSGRFDLADFTLSTAEMPLKVRDSKKHDFSVSITRAEVQR